jgi:WD40 repeat protein
VASTAQSSHLTFWPLKRAYPAIVDGYFTGIIRPVAFSHDSRWLVTSWTDRRLRLWPVTDRGLAEPRTLDPAVPPGNWRSMAFDPKGRFVFAVGGMSQAWVYPVDGSPVRRLECPIGGGFNSAAVSPSGRRVATAFFYGKGPARLCAWDLETGERRQFDLPEGERAAPTASPVRTGYEQGVFHLAFADENRLFTAGDGGLRLWDLETGTHEIVAASAPGYALVASWSADARVALTAEVRMGRFDDCRRTLLQDLAHRTSRPLTQFGTCGSHREVGQLDASGTLAVTGGRDGIARVGRLSSAQPHLLLGHKGVVDRVAVSPDLRWVATAGEDNTLRLWPMPDLTKPPLHTLPHGELLAKLRSLTNIRVVRDAASSEGWRLEVGLFPGWKTIPEW